MQETEKQIDVDQTSVLHLKNVDITGCYRLWATVVHQAIKDIDQSPRGAAADWLYSKRRGVGSMRWICDMLDLDYYKLLNLCMTRAGRAVILKKDRRRNPDKRKKKTMEEEE